MARQYTSVYTQGTIDSIVLKAMVTIERKVPNLGASSWKSISRGVYIGLMLPCHITIQKLGNELLNLLQNMNSIAATTSLEAASVEVSDSLRQASYHLQIPEEKLLVPTVCERHCLRLRSN